MRKKLKYGACREANKTAESCALAALLVFDTSFTNLLNETKLSASDMLILESRL